ncbi:MAG TPA: ribosome maturation factor RimP [Candidatus Hydrothermia bacterium]|nr:ribosome maturation factor RimP [Candidatus Hydrothermae bacterium]MDD3649272.1 ribosome maturation factor RimP [Candidatus Hydrothermia bacterium]MDD5573131.1 ribosome maturation factor RimP [Candidatus Hydrothermia bacterium]HOK22686.1 ribosome maturation factor RimP [Candidatus Hydrothermia bacterium]HOL23395.1 ribosome maturation factor RimP [Candidatus Hydrothermia bacterium]
MNANNYKDIEERVLEMIEKITEGTGIMIVDVSIKGIGGKKKLEVSIDREGGITLSECEKISNEISLLLDSENIIPGSYILEVGSPGLNRILKTDRELAWAKGKRVIIYTKDKSYSGGLKAVDNEFIYIDSGEKIPRVDIKKIKLNEV